MPNGSIAEKLFPQKCGCTDCEAAVSPAAYLAALIDYLLKHVRHAGSKMDLKFLEDHFYQPFGELPGDCDGEDKKIRQVRICIEVLRRYLGKRPIADAIKEAALEKAEKDYCFTTYSLLLSRFNTNYEEIRRIRNAGDDERKALAERLGIDLTIPRFPGINGDELDQLYLDPQALPTATNALTEQVLEQLFGLADTTRDPLSEGVKLGDEQVQITRWNLNGIAWKVNTDSSGNIYVQLTKDPVTTHVSVYLYQDKARLNLVASGEIRADNGQVQLKPAHDSGLSGVFDIQYVADSSSIIIVAIPALMTWQLQHLRSLWWQQDWPEDAYAASQRLPIIDPDLTGPDDFRFPVQKNAGQPDQAFDLWLERRAWVDAALANLKSLRENDGLPVVLETVFNPLPDFKALLFTLTKGGTTTEVNNARAQLSDLHLTTESFLRLMGIYSKDQVTGMLYGMN